MDQEYKSESLGVSTIFDDNGGTEIDEAKLLRKIDLHVLPMLVLIYIAAFLDR